MYISCSVLTKAVVYSTVTTMTTWGSFFSALEVISTESWHHPICIAIKVYSSSATALPMQKKRERKKKEPWLWKKVRSKSFEKEPNTFNSHCKKKMYWFLGHNLTAIFRCFFYCLLLHCKLMLIFGSFFFKLHM